MVKACFLSLIMLLFSFGSNAQDDDEMGQRFFFGANVGVKFANKNYANRYGGWYQDQLRNLIDPNNFVNYNTIYDLLGQRDFFLLNDLDAFPFEVRYTPGLLTGVMAGYKLSPNFQMSLDANFSKLKFRSAYTIEVIDPSITFQQDRWRTGYIYAEESRFNGRFNLDYVINDDPLNYLVGASGLFHAWRIDEHIAIYDSWQTSLFSKFNQTNNTVGPKVSGMGWGFGLNAGIEYRFTEKIVAQLMYQPYMMRADYFNTKTTIANLGASYEKDKFRFEHDLTVRILWK